MSNHELKSLREILSAIHDYPDDCWLYLPTDEKWTLESRAAVLKSEEVPPEQEHDKTAGIPAFATENLLMQTLVVSTIQDIVENLLWTIPDEYPEGMIGSYLKDRSPDRFVFRKGSPVTVDRRPVVQFKSPREALARYDVLPNSALVPLVSEAVCELLSKLCPHDIQFIEVDVITASEPIHGYKFLNAIHRVSCIDHEQSEYTFIPGTDAIMGFKRLRLNSTCLGDHEIARETEYTPHLYVSSRVKDEFSSKHFRGYEFVAPEVLFP